MFCFVSFVKVSFVLFLILLELLRLLSKVKYVISSPGADVNACTPLGRSPLHVAAAMGHGHIVDLLLEKGRV